MASNRIVLFDFTDLEVPPFSRFSFGKGGAAAKGAQLTRYTDYRRDLAKLLMTAGAYRRFPEPMTCPVLVKAWIFVKHDRPDGDNELKNVLDGLAPMYGWETVGKEKIRVLKWRGIIANDKQVRGSWYRLHKGPSRLVVALYPWIEQESLDDLETELAGVA
jgi:hypothetical protein